MYLYVEIMMMGSQAFKTLIKKQINFENYIKYNFNEKIIKK